MKALRIGLAALAIVVAGTILGERGDAAGGLADE